MLLPELDCRTVGEYLCPSIHYLRCGVSGTDNGIGTKGFRLSDHASIRFLSGGDKHFYVTLDLSTNEGFESSHYIAPYMAGLYGAPSYDTKDFFHFPPRHPLSCSDKYFSHAYKYIKRKMKKSCPKQIPAIWPESGFGVRT